MIRRMLLVALALALPSAAGAGIENAGTTAANFLSVGPGAGVLGMGGATLAIGGDVQRATWNVASLASVDATQFAFSHAGLAAQNSQEWIAAGGRLGAGRTRWSLSGLYQGDGSFDGRDINNLPTGSFNASSMALGAAIAQPLGPAVSVGVGLKYVSESLGDVSGAGVAFDLGLLARSGPLGFGVAAQNAFGSMSYDGASYPFPSSYGVGASLDVPGRGVTLALDFNVPDAYYSDARFGVEWRHRDVLALRTGYRMEMGAGDGEPLTGPTFGMGAGANGFWFDYGYVVGGAGAGGQHRVGLSFHPGVMNARMSGSEAPTIAPRPASTAPAPSPKVRQPKVETPAKAETPKQAQPKAETPAKAETPKQAKPRAETPAKVETPKQAKPKAETPAQVKPSTSKPAPKDEAVAVVLPKLDAAAKAASTPTAARALPAPAAEAPAVEAQVPAVKPVALPEPTKISNFIFGNRNILITD